METYPASVVLLDCPTCNFVTSATCPNCGETAQPQDVSLNGESPLVLALNDAYDVFSAGAKAAQEDNVDKVSIHEAAATRAKMLLNTVLTDTHDIQDIAWLLKEASEVATETFGRDSERAYFPEAARLRRITRFLAVASCELDHSIWHNAPSRVRFISELDAEDILRALRSVHRHFPASSGRNDSLLDDLQAVVDELYLRE